MADLSARLAEILERLQTYRPAGLCGDPAELRRVVAAESAALDAIAERLAAGEWPQRLTPLQAWLLKSRAMEAARFLGDLSTREELWGRMVELACVPEPAVLRWLLVTLWRARFQEPWLDACAWHLVAPGHGDPPPADDPRG